MNGSHEVIRTINTAQYCVEVFIIPEQMDPADTIAFGDDAEAQEAERDYLEKIRSGSLPWVIIGVEVSVKTSANWMVPNVVGRDYLGGCDYLPFSKDDRQTRDMVRAAIEDARLTLSAGRSLRATS